MAARDLRRVLGVRGEPDFVRDVVWRRAIPQYSRHHPATLERCPFRTKRALPA